MFESITVRDLDGRPLVHVFAKFQDADFPVKIAADGQIAAAILAAVKRSEFTGAVGNLVETFVAPAGSDDSADGKLAGKDHKKDKKKRDKETGAAKRIIVVGLGKASAFRENDLRAAAAAVARRLASTKEATARVHVGATLEETKTRHEIDHRQAGRCFGEGLGLLAWNNQQFKGKATDKAKRTALVADVVGKVFRKGVEHGLAICGGVNLARTLSETPPNIATPRFMAEQCKLLAKESGGSIRVTVFEGKDLQTERLTGHESVGKASENKPCMIRMEYTPKKPRKNAKKIVLIGKTVCYDTGGLSLKVNNGMVGMKRDKDGGCAVIGAMRQIAATIKPDVPVVALLCAAENSVSDCAYRPDDILTYRNGVTVEVTNTDAEGRLVLADALCWACEKENPALIIDLATLTGGVVTALGSTFCGMFCEDDALRARVEAASATSGERVWRLPMHAEYRDMMKSPVADILNSNSNRKAHPIQGAAFLSYFVEEKVPWCHLDIAGVHVSDSDSGCFVKGPTGWGVRLLCDFLEAY